MGERVPSPGYWRWALVCTGKQFMEREYVKEDFVWKRLNCDGAMVNHLGSQTVTVIGGRTHRLT